MSSECETADTGGKGRSLAKSTLSHRSAHTKKDHVKTQAQRHVYYPRSSDIITCHHISSHCTHSYPFMTNYIDLLYFFCLSENSVPSNPLVNHHVHSFSRFNGIQWPHFWTRPLSAVAFSPVAFGGLTASAVIFGSCRHAKGGRQWRAEATGGRFKDQRMDISWDFMGFE